ncbi:ubiquitous surface protein A1 UspA1, partial [Moraxella catarrhalis 46P47B1]
MNKIYKVKKNAAGHSVACSEFAKGHTKKAVLGSLLIVGALGMATTASAQLARVGGHTVNKQDGAHVGGGGYNQATGRYSTVSGGATNQATGENSTVGGGLFNQATGKNSTVGGGNNNEATGENSTVGGGATNQAEGIDSTIAGGRGNQATGTGSFAAGVENKANADNAVALGKENNIEGKGSVAIGSKNTVKKDQENVFILGSNTNTENAQSGSVLLGNETAGKEATAVSEATVDGLSLKGFAGGSNAGNGTVSVGSKGKERQIVNVGAGEISDDSTDAVNGSQLHALAKVVADNYNDILNNLDDIYNLDDGI